MGTPIGGLRPPEYNLQDIQKYTSPQKRPGGFRRILGAVTGGVANIFAPGLGSLIGGFIGGQGSSVCMDQMAMLAKQEQMQKDFQWFSMKSNIMKTQHNAAMTAINNMKS